MAWQSVSQLFDTYCSGPGTRGGWATPSWTGPTTSTSGGTNSSNGVSVSFGPSTIPSCPHHCIRYGNVTQITKLLSASLFLLIIRHENAKLLIIIFCQHCFSRCFCHHCWWGERHRWGECSDHHHLLSSLWFSWLWLSPKRLWDGVAGSILASEPFSVLSTQPLSLLKRSLRWFKFKDSHSATLASLELNWQNHKNAQNWFKTIRWKCVLLSY